MRIEKLDYILPKELIAQRPVRPRDSARLLVYERNTRNITHSNFKSITDYLRPGDLLILNKTKVFPARIYTTNSEGKKIEIVFLAEIEPKKWEVLIGGKVQEKEKLQIGQDFYGIVDKKTDSMRLSVNLPPKKVYQFLEKNGHIPVPPYIKRKDRESDKAEYQTIFAKKIGSAAAPTAGMHFTKPLLSKLKRLGVEIEYITLHVGLGTFAPVKTKRVEDHPIHTEYFEIDKEAAERVHRAKKEGRRVIACGTTVVRSLESASDVLRSPLPWKVKENTKLFIYPGYKFRAVDGIITNFHTPRSSLLALVFAFAGEKNIKAIYSEAIKQKYRFFSYGDGMLIF